VQGGEHGLDVARVERGVEIAQQGFVLVADAGVISDTQLCGCVYVRAARKATTGIEPV
jgi:hypothetical protein